MQLEHSFTVPVGIDDAWRILLDIERIGPCMPGAAIDSVDGDDFTGTVKVKLGPVNLTYKGKASFVEKDEATHRAVIDARGRDARGNGTAAAKVTATLGASGGQTTVTVLTDLDITGKPAQFGRGVMVDVGNKLIGQFADCLARTIGGDTGDATAAAAPAAASPAAVPEVAPAAKPAAKKAAKKTARPKPTSSAAPVEQSAPQPVEQGAAAAQEEPAVAAPDADAAPAFGAPGGITAPQSDQEPSVNGHSRSTPQKPQREVEPIDLLQSAGPAIARRAAPILAPVAIGIVFVLAAQRRRRGKRA